MSTEQPTPAVAYAAKSTTDPKGSIGTQLADARKLAGKQGLDLQPDAEYHDEAASAYRGNRGPNLARAMQHAERLAAEHGVCALIVQHSDRLARGDGVRAKHLVEYELWARKANVTLLSVQDQQTFGDLLYAVVTGQRNHEDSARKSKSVRDGLQRRKDSGAPVGRIPLGYRHQYVVDGEGQPQLDRYGKPITERVIDPVALPIVERIFAEAETGATNGEIARVLNQAGLRGKRGRPFVARTVRTIIHNTAYRGDKGYPTIVEPERYDAVIASLERLDPVTIAKRAGGRKPRDESYFLRGIAFCAQCGSTLYTVQQARGRTYQCRHRREHAGICDAATIPADLLETHVLNHLHVFVGGVEDWLDKQIADRNEAHQTRVAAIEQERQALADLDRQRGVQFDRYRSMGDDPLAVYVLEEIQRIDAEREAQAKVIAEAEAMAAEWEGPPDVDAALDFYTALLDLVQGKVTEAAGAVALNRTLREVLAGLWVEFETDRDRLLVQFELRVPHEATIAGGDRLLPFLQSDRAWLPPARPGHQPIDAEVATVLREHAGKPGPNPRSTAA